LRATALNNPEKNLTSSKLEFAAEEYAKRPIKKNIFAEKSGAGLI
jgi:hypothetical protein